MPDPDNVPDEFAPQIDQIRSAVLSLSLAAYARGVREGIESSAAWIDRFAANLRQSPVADQVGGLLVVLEQVRDGLRLSALEVTTPEVQ